MMAIERFQEESCTCSSRSPPLPIKPMEAQRTVRRCNGKASDIAVAANGLAIATDCSSDPCVAHPAFKPGVNPLGEEFADVWPRAAQFYAFCYCRQAMYHRRRLGACHPWSRDAVLRELFFCNIYREIDRGTEFFHRHLQRMNGPNVVRKALWASVIYRLANRVRTFKAWGTNRNRKHGFHPTSSFIPSEAEISYFRRFLQRKMANYDTVFTAAHQCMGLKRYLDTIRFLIRNMDDLTRLILQATSMREIHAILRRIHNVGGFFAWQITCDLIEAEPVDLGCFSQDEWACFGLGSAHGLRYIFGNQYKNSQKVEHAQLLQRVQHTAFTECLGVLFPKWHGKYLTLKNMEHALCEFFRYTKWAFEGAGRPRVYQRDTGDDR